MAANSIDLFSWQWKSAGMDSDHEIVLVPVVVSFA
jgi:hypothetical protein